MKFRRKHSVGSLTANPGFQIAPMIDVVFVILLFFMVAAGDIQVEKHLPSRLPSWEQVPSANLPPLEVEVRVDADGQVFLNDDLVDENSPKDLPELAATLKDMKRNVGEEPGKLICTIVADEKAKYQRVVDVLGAFQRAGIQGVTFSAVAE